MKCEWLEWYADQGSASRSVRPSERGVGGRQYHLVMSNIVGLGIDATDIPRIAATIERYGNRFVHRIFTDGEVAYCTRRKEPAIHFAGRFAAKEAAMKALGTGHTQNVLWRDVEIVRHGGPPQLVFHGGAAVRFAAIGARSSLLTITHAETLAFAQVLLLAP
jgi:holo-[acyl-carrier protein] synthase